ncbi:hypothetical protein GCM10010167_55400 [Paractinoplanes deccanensis]
MGAGDDLDPAGDAGSEAGGVAGDDAHRRARVEQVLDHLATDLAGGSRNNDHASSQRGRGAKRKDQLSPD